MSLSIGSNSASKLPPKPLSQLINSSSIIKEQENAQVPAPMSKLHQYFESSQFLSSQQQLSVFIENFPIIDIESSHRSINEILPMLIKQNEMLGKKCQSQVLLIKESFSKQQNINKQNRKLKEEMELVQSQCRQLIKQKQSQVAESLKLSQSLSTRLKVCSQFILTQNQLFKTIISNGWKNCEELTNSRNVRIAYDDFMAQIKQINQQNSQEKQNLNQKEQIVSLQQIEKYAKQQRKRAKYYSRVKSSVEEFCTRLVKISTVVPAELLSKELSYECSQFMEIVAELVSQGEGRKRREESVSKRQKQRQANQVKLSSVNSDSSLFSKSELQVPISHNNRSQLNREEARYEVSDKQQTLMLRSGGASSFEGILNSFLAQSTKKYEQRISQLQSQLSEVRQQYETSKQYYESYLVNAKMEYEKEKRDSEEQITIKDEMIKHFEQELEKCFGFKEQLENRVAVLTKENEQMKVRQNPLVHEIQQLNQQLKLNEQAIQKAIQRNKTLQDSLSEQLSKKEQEFEQTILKLESKLKLKEQEHEEQLDKKSVLIKQKDDSISALNQEIRQLKETVEDKNLEISRITKRLQAIEQDHVKKLEGQVQQIQQEIDQTKKSNRQLSKTIAQLNQEVFLNTTYIQELESKLQKKDEALQKLNKKLSSQQIEKKSLKQLKETNQKLQAQLETSSVQLRKALEENSSLKKLVKGMKKQLEEVYHTINDLKSIQKDRERLVLQSQKSQRWKEQIMKDYDEMKYEILKVEAENKSLALEVRHYKNALKRIQMIN